jgi:FkbM family methyltransferase
VIKEKNLRDLWMRGKNKLTSIFSLGERSGLGSVGEQVRATDTALIVATAPPERPNDRVAELVTRILKEDQSFVLLRIKDPLAVSANRSSGLLEIEMVDSRPMAYSKLSIALSNRRVRRILSIPQSAGDLLNAIAAGDITGAPLAVWITEGHDFQLTKSELLGEALRKAKLCFTASEPLRAEIQKHYGIKVWMIPTLHSVGETGRDRPFQDGSPELLNGLTDWIWKSIEAGAPIDDRFERLFAGVRNQLTPYVDPPAPADIHWEMQPHFQALYRLKASGYKFDFVVDVGASTGYWSHIAQKIFPYSKYFLVEPLLKKYLETEGTIYRLHPEFVKIEAAAGNAPGKLEMNVSPDLYGSSFFDSSVRSGPPVQVSVRTLDEIAASESIQGRGLLKIDAQFSEHLVLEGGIELLKQVDVVFLEVSLRRIVPECKIFVEIVNQLHELGFEYREYAGTWRDPSTGELLQQDAIFARHSV